MDKYISKTSIIQDDQISKTDKIRRKDNSRQFKSKMSQLSKFINLVIEYGQKIQSTLNKKYKPFIRSICNLQQLAKSVDPQNICLTHQMIIFKLGLEAKATKSIQVSLLYLHKFLANKFVDLDMPNYCEQFQIQETTVRRKQNTNPKSDMRNQLIRLLQPLLHFRSNDINLLLFRVYEFLITQPISQTLIELNLLTPNTEIGQKILYNYYSYRFYIYEEIYTFTEQEFKSINALSIRNEKINRQIQQAFLNHQSLLDLVHKYVGEMVTTVTGTGGKYGLCVICNQPADYFCKITKASLCGADCKKRHLDLAQKQYKGYYQAVNLWKQIQPNFSLLLQTLIKRQSRCILSVLVALLEKAHLFMIIKRQFRNIIGKHVAGIINIALGYKDQLAFQVIYNLVTVLCRFWMVQSMSSIQYFFKQSVLKILEDKRPNFKLLIILFKSLAKIFQYGKTSVQLYINFDCEYNKTNLMQRMLFELSKICQDKFASSIYYNKNEKLTIRNGAVALLSILVKGLNQYRILYPQKVVIEQEILQIKQRKINLEKFIHKFNEHWSQGLKMLFNLNMVGLDSQSQIVQILLTIKGLRKDKIQQMLLSQNGGQFVEIIFQKIIKAGPFMDLVQLFRVVPLKKSSVLLKHYSDFVVTRKVKPEGDQDGQNKQYIATKLVSFLTTNYSLKDLQRWSDMENIKINGSLDHMYMKCLQTKNQVTLGTHKTYFRHCISESYLEVFASQLSLLQIPLLFLLQTAHPHEKIFEIITELIQICPHANWVALCLKNIDIQKIKSGKYSAQDHSLIIGCLKLCKTHAEHIHDWSSILQFICKLYRIINSCSENHKRLVINTTSVLQESIKIKQELTVLELQEYLLMIGQNCSKNFNNFIVSLVNLSEEQLQKEDIFFLQKTFEILQHNLSKFIRNFQYIYRRLQGLIKKIIKFNASVKQKQQSNLSQCSDPAKASSIQQPYSSETLIYISDMLKQLFVKILKLFNSFHKDPQQIPSIDQQQASKQQVIELSFFKLFSLILECQNRQANDFVMNSISMIVMVNYELKPQTWQYIVLSILKEQCKKYRQQVLTILQKILKQKLLNCELLQVQILNLCLDLIDQKQTKLSIQSMHMLKEFVDLMIEEVMSKNGDSVADGDPGGYRGLQSQLKNSMESEQPAQMEQKPVDSQRLDQQRVDRKEQVQSQDSQSSELVSTSPRKIKQYLLLIISNLIEFISYGCHEGAIQILFIFLKTVHPTLGGEARNTSQLLFQPQEIDLIINKIFKKLESLPKQLLARGQKIMNESLFWSVRNKNYGIVKNLQQCIINKYSSMSYTAMKCIKTFISMTNPKKPQDWNPIQETLVNILKNTHLKDLLTKQDIQVNKQSIDELIEEGKQVDPTQKTNISLSQLSNKLIIQRMTVQVLPNDVKIIDELSIIYNETLQFNDDLYLRCLLWREGLGQNNKLSPPDILSLQELISYRIISTYYWSKQYQKIADFTLDIIHRYCKASRKWQQLQSNHENMQSNASNKTFELYMLSKDYWLKRRQPLKVIINYMLPKLPKICKNYQEKEKLLEGIIQGMKFCEERAPYVETIRQMTLVR